MTLSMDLGVFPVLYFHFACTYQYILTASVTELLQAIVGGKMEYKSTYWKKMIAVYAHARDYTR